MNRLLRRSQSSPIFNLQEQIEDGEGLMVVCKRAIQHLDVGGTNRKVGPAVFVATWDSSSGRPSLF